MTEWVAYGGIVFPRRGGNCPWYLLAVQCSWDALFHMRRRKWHVARHRAWRGKCCSAFWLGWLRASRICCQTRSWQLGVQHLSHLDVWGEEETVKDGHSCPDWKSVTARVHDKWRWWTVIQSTSEFKYSATIQHGRYPQSPEQGLEESEELLHGGIYCATSYYRTTQVDWCNEFQRPSHAAKFLILETRFVGLRRPFWHY